MAKWRLKGETIEFVHDQMEEPVLGDEKLSERLEAGEAYTTTSVISYDVMIAVDVCPHSDQLAIFVFDQVVPVFAQ